MASPDDSDLQTRRKRALLVAGAIGLAAIAWNANDWFDDDIVSVQVGDNDEARNVAREVRDQVRQSIRGSRDDARDESTAARGDEDEEADSLPRITETAEGLRVESGDGRAVTIRIEDDAADAAREPAETEN